MAVATDTFDERLARSVLEGDGNEVNDALTLYERHPPASLEDAVALIGGYGPITPDAFEHAAQAWDIHRHVWDVPGD